MTVLLVAIVLIVLALLGAPLFVVICAGALIGFASWDTEFLTLPNELLAVPSEFYRIADMQVLIAIPLFTFAGYLLSESQAPRRLVRVTQALLGWLPGGLAVVCLTACALFTAFTGASGVTIIALGALLYPALNQAGYRERFNLGLVTTSGSLGLLFAPSLPLIMYGVVVQQMDIGVPVSIDQLFLAGLVPGVLMIAMLAGYSLWVNRHVARDYEGFSGSELRAALREAIWEIPLPFVVLGGIYSGYFAVSEAAAVTAMYVLIVEVGVMREIPLRQLPGVMRRSMILVGGILIILGMSLASTNVMIIEDVPGTLFDFIHAHVDSAITFLILLNLFLLVLGAMLDIFSALVLVVPLILPVAMGYGIHPVHLGIIFLANMELGYQTPPVGLNLFISSYRFGRPVTEVYVATLPFLGILLLSVLIITYWPGLSLWLID